jgi:uncharacterized protein YjbJ (UPF0337 family)
MGELSDKAKGKAKEIEGDLTGNTARRNEGLADQVKGNVKGVARKAENAGKNIADAAKTAFGKDTRQAGGADDTERSARR